MCNKKIRLRFLSTMKHIVGRDEEIIEITGEATVDDLLRLISTTHGNKIAETLFEKGTNSIRNDLLVLVNDADITVLRGIDTTLSEGDEVSLMPIAHGG